MCRKLLDSCQSWLSKSSDHACPPLTTHIMLLVRPVGSLIPIPSLYATRDIAAGEELTWDYQDAGGEGWFYGRHLLDVPIGLDRVKCRCGSLLCRGFIPYDPTL